MGSKRKPKRSLVDFVLDQKRKDCRVCKLEAGLRAQLKEAAKRKIPRRVWLEWLALEHGIKLTGADFDAHYSGRHENG